MTQNGEDLTQAFEKGAEIALQRARSKWVDLVIFKERSPSCGVREIHDGYFSGRIISGEGLTTQKLREDGFKIFSDEEIPKIKEYLEAEDDDQSTRGDA